MESDTKGLENDSIERSQLWGGNLRDFIHDAMAFRADHDLRRPTKRGGAIHVTMYQQKVVLGGFQVYYTHIQYIIIIHNV